MVSVDVVFVVVIVCPLRIDVGKATDKRKKILLTRKKKKVNQFKNHILFGIVAYEEFSLKLRNVHRITIHSDVSDVKYWKKKKKKEIFSISISFGRLSFCPQQKSLFCIFRFRQCNTCFVCTLASPNVWLLVISYANRVMQMATIF